MRRRRVGFLLIFGALVPLVVAATAWACGVLATVKLDRTVAAPGQELNVTGINYSAPGTTFTPVQIRWNSRSGPVIATAVPDASGRISTTARVPAGTEPGWYVVNGTQFRLSDGTPKSGTPGRTTLRVQGAAQSSSSPWSGAPGAGAGVTVDGGPGGPPLVPTLLGLAMSLGLLGGGLTLVSRSRGRRAHA